MTGRPKPRTVKLARSTRRPSRAELEELIDLRKPDGSRPTMDALAKAMVSPVKIDGLAFSPSRVDARMRARRAAPRKNARCRREPLRQKRRRGAAHRSRRQTDARAIRRELPLCRSAGIHADRRQQFRRAPGTGAPGARRDTWST